MRNYVVFFFIIILVIFSERRLVALVDEATVSFVLNSVRLSFFGGRGRWDHITVDPTPKELKRLIAGFHNVLYSEKSYSVFRIELKQRRTYKVIICEKIKNHIEITQKHLGTRTMQIEIELSLERFARILKKMKILLRAINQTEEGTNNSKG
ncbi:hypothetical protein ACFL35_20370 [Candidatus Riflebacteria bacterium]